MAISCYFTFPTVFFALRAESVLNENKTISDFKMVPVPRSISSSCGTALRCCCQDIDTIKNILASHDVQWEDVHQIEEKALRLPGFLGRKKGDAKK